MKKDRLFTDMDRCRLGRLLASNDARALAPWQVLDKIECLLEETEAMRPEAIPDDVVTMNSTVRLIQVDSLVEVTYTVVYPEDVGLLDDGISVLEPLGTQLIGCEVGDLVECENQKTRGTWRVAQIVFQPERVGKFEL